MEEFSKLMQNSRSADSNVRNQGKYFFKFSRGDY